MAAEIDLAVSGNGVIYVFVQVAATIETRVVAGLVIAILMAAFGSLYVLADFTDVSFAWTIRPATTAIIIGEGYLAGALFFTHVILSKNWNTVQSGFLPITAFTGFMLAATFLHWDKFHQGTFVFYVWLLVYVVTPLLVLFHTSNPPVFGEMVSGLSNYECGICLGDGFGAVWRAGGVRLA